MITANRKRQAAAASALAVVAAVLIIAGLRSAQDSTRSATPPYYREVPANLPPVLESKKFSDAETRASYKAASEHSALFAQLPCYCYCERTNGHKSLLSCFADTHGTECSICRREALFAASEVKRGKTVVQIRDEIIRGLWSKADADVNNIKDIAGRQ